MSNEGSSGWDPVKKRFQVVQAFKNSKKNNDEQSKALWEKKKKRPHVATPTTSAYDDVVPTQMPQQGQFGQGLSPVQNQSWTNMNYSHQPSHQSTYPAAGFGASPVQPPAIFQQPQQSHSPPNLVQSPTQFSDHAQNHGWGGHAEDYYHPPNNSNYNGPETGAGPYGSHSWPPVQGNGNSGYTVAPVLEAGRFDANHFLTQPHHDRSLVNNNFQDSGRQMSSSTPGPYQQWDYHDYGGGPSTAPAQLHRGSQSRSIDDYGNASDDGSAAALAMLTSRRSR